MVQVVAFFLARTPKSGEYKSMRYVKITKEEMDDVLKAEKGWVRNVTGYEYVYDFHLSQVPVIVKVMSSVRVQDGQGRNRGSDAIRVFAVKKAGMGKDARVVSGLLKSKRVYRVEGWRDNLKTAVLNALTKAKQQYRRRS